MRTIGVVTTSRADYGSYLPVLRELSKEPTLETRLFVTGMHLSPDFGLTVQPIEADGFAIQERVEMLLASDTPEGISKSMGLGTIGFAQAFARWKPDILVVLGDRFEMHAAAVAAVPFNVPLAHIHGGEVTAGAIDEAFRHSLTKMSHLHFVATETYAHRVMRMGEEPWRITVSGAPSLDNLRVTQLLPPDELRNRIGLCVPEKFLLVTLHPATLDPLGAELRAAGFFRGVEALGLPLIVTMPNADPGGKAVRRVIRDRAAANPLIQPVENLGTQAYFSLMALAAAMVGNSSSGIVEASSFGLPVVNVGLRQNGRERPRNVIDCSEDEEEVRIATTLALSEAFNEQLRGLQNPYGMGHAGRLIAERLTYEELGSRLLIKHFYDTA